jgi:DNA-binding LacI/PurR family transcriptional regulator
LLISFQKMEDDWHVRYQDSHRADGLILLGYGDYTLYESRLRQLVASETRFVRWGSVSDSNIGATVGSDNVGAGRLAGEHLLAQGCRRIAFLGQADDHYPEFADRYRGLCAVMTEAGHPADPALQCGALSSEGDGHDAVQAMLREGLKFDAIFAASDLIAIGAMRAVTEAGLRVPQDVAVIGFDDIPAACLTSPPLTTIMQDLNVAGELLVETLLAAIEDHPNANTSIPAKLVVRASSGLV